MENYDSKANNSIKATGNNSSLFAEAVPPRLISVVEPVEKVPERFIISPYP
jgi:hypothetical protein